MPRGVAKDAFANEGNANNLAGMDQANANSLYGTLAPELEQEATNPQGYSAKDLSAMNTAVQQSSGGATAGAVGQGNLMAARTRNAGAFQPALDASAQEGNRINSQEALGVQASNANLKQQQQQAGLAGMQGLYGSNVSAGMGEQGLANSSLMTALDADKATQAAIQGYISDAEEPFSSSGGFGSQGAFGQGSTGGGAFSGAFA